jgi:hypothetical protein
MNKDIYKKIKVLNLFIFHKTLILPFFVNPEYFKEIDDLNKANEQIQVYHKKNKKIVDLEIINNFKQY